MSQRNRNDSETEWSTIQSRQMVPITACIQRDESIGILQTVQTQLARKQSSAETRWRAGSPGRASLKYIDKFQLLPRVKRKSMIKSAQAVVITLSLKYF